MSKASRFQKTELRTSPFRPPSPTTTPPQSQTEDAAPPLEIVFSFNTAGAYGAMPTASKKYIKDLIRCMDSQLLHRIISLNTLSRTRIAIFAHGIHDKIRKKYGIKYVDFTDDVNDLCQFVDDASPLTWGSVRHCYELVLRKTRSLSWTPGSRRVLVLVGSTDSHFGRHPDSDELIHWDLEARCLAQKGITAFTVEVRIDNVEHRFYRPVAEMTEGCYILLEQLTEMKDVITAIVCHVLGPDYLEKFEQDVIDREDFSLDVMQLIATLRQHDDAVTSFPNGTEYPGTPQGSDFGDDDDGNLDDDNANLAAEKLSPENSEVPDLKRRSSLRLKQNSMLVSKSEKEIEIEANESSGQHISKLKRQSTSSLITLKTADRAGAGTKLTKQQTVSFYLPDVTDESRKQKVMTSTTPADFVSKRAGFSLKKSQTVTLPVRSERKTASADSQVGNPADEVVNDLTTRRSNTRKRPALKKGVTEVGLGTSKNKGPGGINGDLTLSGPCAAKVYKIDREAPAKREEVLPRAFTLHHLSWSLWKLVISPCLPTQAKNQWEPRLQNTQGGFRRTKIVSEGEGDAPALYEIALKPEKMTKKYVVFYSFLPELDASSSWEDQIFVREDIQQEVSKVIQKKCSVFLRRAPFSQTVGRAQAIIQAALHKYDYAWNDVQGFSRPIRHVDFL